MKNARKLLLTMAAAGAVMISSLALGITAFADETITMWTFLDPADTTNGRSVALAQMIEEFEADNPGVKVQVEPQDWNTMTAQFLAAHATGDAPDLIWCISDGLCGVLDAGALVPLEDLFMGDWTEEEIADVDDPFFQFGERDGKHYTLTLSKNAVVLYYRQDLLDAAGLSVPTTFDELKTAAEALTGTDEETGIQRYGLGQAFSLTSSDYQLITNYIHNEQGSLFNEDGTANWATEAGVAAVNWTKDMIDSGFTPMESVNTTNEDTITEFEAGKYGMLVLGAVRLPSIRAAASFDPASVQIAPIPGGCVLDGWFAGVWSGSEHQEMAGKFLEKMYSPEADKLWVELGGQAPVRKSTIDNLEITDENSYLQVMLDAFDTGFLCPNDMTYTGYKVNLNDTIQQVMSGVDPMEALEKTAADFNSANNR